MNMNKLVLAFVFSLPACALATENDPNDIKDYSSAEISCPSVNNDNYSDYYVREVFTQDFIESGVIKNDSYIKISKTPLSTERITVCLSPSHIPVAIMAKLYLFPVTVGSKGVGSALEMNFIVDYKDSLFDNAKRLRDK